MAYGFVPVKHLAGGVLRANEYKIADDFGTAIFSGDPVALVDGGVIEEGVAADGVALIGVFYGVQFKNDAGEVKFSRHWPAAQSASEIKAYVYDDPNIVYKVESDQDTTALAQASVGSNADFARGTGDTATGQSRAFIDSSTVTDAAPGTANFRILGSAQLDGTFTSAGTVMDVYVKFNEHMFYNEATGL